MPLRPGSLVVAHLVGPSEKLWGLLEELGPAGVTLRAMSLASFDDWSTELAREGRSGLGLATLFVPLHRVERIFLDERVGDVESYTERFARRVGRPVAELLDPGPGSGG